MKIKTIILATSAILAANASIASTVPHKNIRLSHDHKPSHLTASTAVNTDIRDADPLARDRATISPLRHTFKNRLLAKSAEQVTAAATCATTAELAGVTGGARNDLMKTQDDYTCFEDNIWTTPTADMQSLFNESAMIDIANEARALALSYDGTSANKLRFFVAYLRSGKWTQEQAGNSGIIGNHGSALDDAIVSFLDAFAANGNFYQSDETHAYLAKEVMILMYTTDPADRYRYLPQAIGILDAYAKEWGSNGQNWFTKTLIYIYRARDDAAFINAVEADLSLVNALDRFLKNNTDLIGHSQEPQFNDAASELGRILKYSGATRSQAQNLIKDFLSRHSMTGDASEAWFRMMGQVDYYDGANCSFYNTCNYKAELEAQILPITHACSSTLTIRAQQLTNGQLSQICDELGEQESYFHQRLNTNNIPVADDHNSALELVIYDSTAQYKKFSYHIYGNSTDNGGIYLEGDPSVVGNVARFFAHEADWLLPEFAVWNLKHEYVHYLDGRFNKYGDFGDFNAHDSVWWGEGLAEYIANKDYNDNAVAEARKNTYKLSELLRTNYDHSSSQIYDWSYLAVRFMFENEMGYVNNILSELRTGDFNAYNNILDNIGTSLDTEFAAWLQTVQSTTETPTEPDNVLENGQSVVISSDGSEQPTYRFELPQGASNLVIQSSGGSGDVDLYVKAGSEVSLSNYDYRPYKSGNNETVSVASPQAGTWYVMGNPYNNQVFDNVSLSASWSEDNGGGTGNVCDSQAAVTRGDLVDNQAVCLGDATIYMAISVPGGQSSLSFTTSGGNGDASIYQSSTGWPGSSNYENAATTANTSEESIVVNNPTSGWHYIMITGQGTGTQLVADYK
ncbi:M9 family metallopeptidase [Thalassomonas actiniarum]|uniref:microbial collagenase n=1 Tax=Thalassomonas actiniarum TaxID=485447 RepID=A0AAF0C3J2_9GAMM|nr:M9 family metallopeptidase [Thalassomonas actiniarum]WDE01257.1 collagenase [Thalassomonas actiniarum]